MLAFFAAAAGKASKQGLNGKHNQKAAEDAAQQQNRQPTQQSIAERNARQRAQKQGRRPFKRQSAAHGIDTQRQCAARQKEEQIDPLRCLLIQLQTERQI